MRDSEIRLSDSEKEQLRQYKNSQYGEQVPFGYVISELLQEVHHD